MDILKKMAAARTKAGLDKVENIVTDTTKSKEEYVREAPKLSLNDMKKEIIEDKPKISKVKDYFEYLIETQLEDSDDEVAAH